MSYTAKFCKQEGFSVLDESGSIIPSFNKIANESDLSKIHVPKMPSILVDIYEKKRETVSIKQTMILKTYSDLERYGFEIVSLRAKNPWRPRQMVIYRLYSRTNIPPGATRFMSFPPGHRVRYDPINKRLRIEGPNISRFGPYGPWIKIEND